MEICPACALFLWSAMVGLIRSVAEAFGVAAGTALIYSVGTAALLLRNGVPDPRGIPRAYLVGAGALFVLYEVVFSQALGLASSTRQALEVGMLNYLWPCLMIVFSIGINKARLRWWVWPGTMLAIVGLYWCMASNGNLDLGGFAGNLMENPVSYALGFTAAVIWALYSNISIRCSGGSNCVPFFFAVIAMLLWIAFFMRNGSLHFPGWGALLQLLLIGVIVGFSYSMWETGIHRGNFILLAACSYFVPAVSMLFAALWLNALPPAAYWGGVGMMIGGSLLCWLASLRKQHAGAEISA